MNMASLLSNPTAYTVENSINVEIATSETTDNPSDTELELGKDLRFSKKLPFLSQKDLARDN